MLVSASTDLEADALYLQIRKGKVARTEELDDWTLVDVDDCGEPLGIEVIGLNRVWPLQRFVERYNVSAELADLLGQFLPAKVQQPWRIFRAYTSGASTSASMAVAAAL